MKLEQIIKLKLNNFKIEVPKEIKADLEDSCWPGYEAIGTKELDGKTVPNCVEIKASKEKFVIPTRGAGETEEEYISKCMKAIGSEYDTQEQALAVCYSQFAEVGPKGGIKGSDKAPNSNTPNKDPKGEGSAKGDASGKSAKVSAEQEKTLQNKVDTFNEKESNTKNGNATLGQLKSVFQRGLGAYNTSHSPLVKSPEQWAYARVNAYLYLLKNGRPENPKYDTDYDLLPKDHPKAK